MLSIILVFAALLSPHFVAAKINTPDPKVQERSVTSAKSWNDYANDLSPHLPTNVVSEFQQQAKSWPMPNSRNSRFGLMIKSAQSGRQAKVEFLKEGAVKINGQDWRINPLVPVKAEVDRLAEFLTAEKKRAALSFLLPLAHAETKFNDDSLGLAAATFAAAYGWKAKHCVGEKLSNDLLKDCVLMAAPMHGLVNAKQLARVNPFGVIVRVATGGGEESAKEKFLPVSLSCPKKGTGTLTLVMENYKGEAQRVRIDMRKDFPKLVYFDFASRGNSKFQNIIKYDPKNEDNEEGNQVLFTGMAVFYEVCQGTKNVQKTYLEKLKANSDSIRSQKSEIETPATEPRDTKNAT